MKVTHELKSFKGLKIKEFFRGTKTKN